MLKSDRKGATAAQADILRQGLAEIELAAEQVEQLILSPLLPAARDGGGDRDWAVGNVQRYLDQLGGGFSAADSAAVARVFDAAFLS
ncbi:MAG: hypothetical protein ACTSX7_08390 [Alphaproteobacteria bacterium]